MGINDNFSFLMMSRQDPCLCQVLKCKAIIRECVKFCEEAEGDKAIPSEHYDADGELPAKFIFCAKCLKGELEEVCASPKGSLGQA